jgi:3-dehydroquinate dehydratase II
MKIAIINGPNLNLVGIREPEIYGDVSFDEYIPQLILQYPDHFISYFQSNHEGAIIDELQRIGYDYDAIVLNAGGLTHTSIVIGDCVKAISAPVVEVHISNIQEREKYRNHSYVTAPSVHFIHGEGISGYQIAIDWVVKNL